MDNQEEEGQVQLIRVKQSVIGVQTQVQTSQDLWCSSLAHLKFDGLELESSQCIEVRYISFEEPKLSSSTKQASINEPSPCI